MAKRCPKRCLRVRGKSKSCRFGVSKTTGKCLKRKRAKKRAGGMTATRAAHAMYG